MAANENVFNFDVSPFLAGVNKIGEGMGRIEGNAKKFGSTITGAVNKSVNGLIMKVGGLIAAFKSAGAVLKQMPEVGQAFGLAKDIFLKNLLWPLRQQVMPLLQKMLDWVRDNRAQFVKWGATVANVFRTVVVVAKTLWEVFKSLVKTVGEAFQKAFNTNFKSFDEFLNVLSFKVSAVIIFIGMLAKQVVADLRPAFEWIIENMSKLVRGFLDLINSWTRLNEQGHSLGTILDHLKETLGFIGNILDGVITGFRDGFVPAIKDAMTPIDNLILSINNLLKTFGLNDKEGLRGFFTYIGSLGGSAFMTVLTAISMAFDDIATAIATVVSAVKVLGLLMTGDFKGALSEVNNMGTSWSDWLKRTKENKGVEDKAFGNIGSKLFTPFVLQFNGTTKKETELLDAVKANMTDATAWQSLINFQRDMAKKYPSAGYDTAASSNLKQAKDSGIKVNDALIMKDGKTFIPSPDDNIFAAKSLPGQSKSVPNINIGPFHISVTEGDAEQAGRNFGAGLSYSFRNNVSNARLAEGR